MGKLKSNKKYSISKLVGALAVLSLVFVSACGTDAGDPIASDDSASTVVEETSDDKADEMYEDNKDNYEAEEAAKAEEDARTTLISLIGIGMPFDNADFNACMVDAIKDSTGSTYAALTTSLLAEEESAELDAAGEAAAIGCISYLSADEMAALVAMDAEGEDEDVEITMTPEEAEAAALALFDPATSLYATASIDHVPAEAGVEFSFEATPVNFTASPLVMVPCSETRQGEMILSEGAGCDIATLIPIIAESVTVSAVSTGYGMCWGIGDIAQSEVGSLCIPAEALK